MLSCENKLQPCKVKFYPKSYEDNDLFKKIPIIANFFNKS